MIHQQKHPNLDVDGCFACKVAHVAIAPSATPSRRGGQVAATNAATEKRWTAEHAAYKRLVRDGVQPDTLDGADRLEQQLNDAGAAA